MRLIGLLILIGVIALMFAGQSFYQSDVEYGKERDIYNYTESTLKWNESISNSIGGNIGDSIQVEEYDINIGRFKNILGKFIGFIGYSSFEVAKWGVEYGYEHPEHDLKFFLNFLIKILWICVIIALIPLVIPLLALIYLFFKGIFYVFGKIFKKDKPKQNETKN